MVRVLTPSERGVVRNVARPTRTKIVCTIGPASESAETIERMLHAGMDCARLNFSHGDYEEHAQTIGTIREMSEKTGIPCAIMQDLQGPKIRIGRIAGGAVELEKGGTVRLRAADGEGDRHVLTTTYRELPLDVSSGDRILLDDGRLVLVVEELEDGEVVRCRVIEGGLLKERKGINLPGVMISTPALTEKDLEDLRFGCEHGVDYVALSFVRRREDIVQLKEELRACGREDVPVIAKLEKPQAVEDLDEILSESAGVMIARGDLGVELPPERVPVLQKEIIHRANQAERLVIVATQMLESMTRSLRPTRAEASDVANAIFDGTDAVMLSAETATGIYPVEAIEMMERITVTAEMEMERSPWQPHPGHVEPVEDYAHAICDAATLVAVEVGARWVVAFTQSGATPALLAKYRPRVPLVAFTPYRRVRNRLAIHWGVSPFVMDIPDTIDRLIEETERRLVKEAIAAEGETIVLVCGAPLDVGGRTNLMKIHKIGEKPRLGRHRG
ncbi:MAG: pyruvate kinase [Gemmatimonadetes bacterium]|nr:pyruvate kinase [Gemmatimonadota bacterium]